MLFQRRAKFRDKVLALDVYSAVLMVALCCSTWGRRVLYDVVRKVVLRRNRMYVDRQCQMAPNSDGGGDTKTSVA